MIRLIGLLGLKGAGKDTAAGYLVEKLGFIRTSFAAKLYSEVAEAYGVTVEFLSNRKTKESPMNELRLDLCKDPDFVAVALDWCVANGAIDLEFELTEPRSPRWTLQLWGTEYRRRSIHGYDSYWLDQVAQFIGRSPFSRHVLTDVRFTNEADWVEASSGILVRVRRPILEEEEAKARAAGLLLSLHSSETELASRKVAHVLVNEEGNPASLVEGLKKIVPDLDQAA